MVIISVSISASEPAVYEVTKKEDTIQVQATNKLIAHNWTQKGLEVNKHKIQDTGNGVEVALGKRKIKLDYAELHDLYIVLKLYEKEHQQEFKLLEVKEL